jgi:hypothetical protein
MSSRMAHVRRAVRGPLAWSMLALLCVGVAACGGGKAGAGSSPDSSSPATTAPSTVAQTGASEVGPAQGEISGDYDSDDDHPNGASNDADNDDIRTTKDRDNDMDNGSHSYYDQDDNSTRVFGRAARGAEASAIAALVRRYFAAAAREDGASACSLIVPTLARSVPEDLGRSSGPLFSRGQTCVVVMSKIFKHYHRQLAAHLASLRVDAVRVEGSGGWAVLAFRALPGRRVRVARVGRAWMMDALLDEELP